MRELRWSFRGLRGFFVFLLGLFSVILFLLNEVKEEIDLLETAYRLSFVMLQLMMGVLLSERFFVVLRRTPYHKFYRSMPKAWEKERSRFLWIDGFFLVCAAAMFAIGVVFRKELAGGVAPAVMLLLFLTHAVVAKLLAVLPWWIWWLQEIVFFCLFLFVPVDRIPVGIGIFAVVVYFIIQFFLYGMLKEYWYTEEPEEQEELGGAYER